VNLENNFKHDISIPKSCRESHDFTNSQMWLTTPWQPRFISL
jgi:hypothetical protein